MIRNAGPRPTLRETRFVSDIRYRGRRCKPTHQIIGASASRLTVRIVAIATAVLVGLEAVAIFTMNH